MITNIKTFKKFNNSKIERVFNFNNQMKFKGENVLDLPEKILQTWTIWIKHMVWRPCLFPFINDNFNVICWCKIWRQTSIYMRCTKFYNGSPILPIFMNERKSFYHMIKNITLYIRAFLYWVFLIFFITFLFTWYSVACSSLSHSGFFPSCNLKYL